VHIDWSTLLDVTVVSAAAALTVVLLVSYAFVGLSPGSARRTGDPERATPAATRAGIATAVLCLLATALIVGYGVYLIVG
jgi:hypothetical protein